MAKPKSEYTPTELRMLDVFRDGLRHSIEELSQHLDDELTEMRTVHWHLFNLRQKLKRKGHAIMIEKSKGKHFYRQVRYLGTSGDE